MKKKRIWILMAIGIGAAVMAVSLQAWSQDKPADNMQLVREKIQADKKLFVGANMDLTESEAKDFWPVYESYQKDLAKLNDRSFKLIQNYADTYETMTDDNARDLLDNYLAIETDRQKIRRAYLTRFRRALPDRKVTRYYQLENKIQAIVNYEMAGRIPLVE